VFGRSFRIATLRGIPVNVDSSWIWIAVLAVYSLWARFDARFELDSGVALLYGVLGAALFFGSVFCHELAHAVTARLAGIRVEGITLVFFGGFTAARSEEKGAGLAFAIAALGPGTSLALGGAFWGLSRLTQGTDGPIPGLFGYLGWVNLFMAVFNVLPGLPLDGGRMLMLVLRRFAGERLSIRAERLTYFVGFAMLLLFLVWVTAFDIARGLGGG